MIEHNIAMVIKSYTNVDGAYMQQRSESCTFNINSSVALKMNLSPRYY